MDPHEQGTHPLGEVACKQSQCELTQLSTNASLTGDTTQKQDEECTTPQNLVNGREDNPKDNDVMETEDEVAGMTTDTSQRRDVDPPTPDDRKKRDHNTNVPVASNHLLIKAPTVTDGDLPLQFLPLTPKRSKKIETSIHPLRGT